MSTLNMISLAVMTLLFLVWVVLMSRMLLRLTRRSLDRLSESGGGYFRWLEHSLSTFRAFLSSEKDRAERRRLYLVTALLFASIIARPLLLIQGG